MRKIDDSYNLFKNARSQRENTDSNYILINLSEKGRLYAPKTFHIKNLSVREVLDISLTDDAEIPYKLLEYLRTKIFEKDIDIGYFSKEEYIETLLIFFRTFYTSSIKQHDYIPQDSDYKYLQDMNGGPTSPEYLKLLNDLRIKKWEPKFNLDLNAVKTYELGENFIKKATIGNSLSNFSYAYGIPHYKDLRDIEDFMRAIFKDEIAYFEPAENLLKLRNEQLKKRLNGEDIPLSSIPSLPKTLETEYNDYYYRRQMMYTKALRAAYLIEYNKKDVSKFPIEDKLQIINDPKIDLRNYTNFLEKLKNQKIGLKPDLQIISPITNATTTYMFSLDSLVALKPFETNNLLELVVSLSKNTANSIDVIMNMQMEQALALHNTLANLAEKERAESEKQKDEQMASAKGMMKAPGFNMGGIQSQFNKMSSGMKMPSMPSMPNMGNIKF